MKKITLFVLAASALAMASPSVQSSSASIVFVEKSQTAPKLPEVSTSIAPQPLPEPVQAQIPIPTHAEMVVASLRKALENAELIDDPSFDKHFFRQAVQQIINDVSVFRK